MRCIDADALEELFREVIGGIAKKPEMNGNLEHMVRASAMVIEMIQDAPTIEPEPHWIHCSERLPEEDYWLGGSARQFSDEVIVSVANYDDEDIWTYISQTIDGEWALELPSHCKIVAWMPLPEPYREGAE